MLARWPLYIKGCNTPPMLKDQTLVKVRTLPGGVHKKMQSKTMPMLLKCGTTKLFITTSKPEVRLTIVSKLVTLHRWYGTQQLNLDVDGLVNQPMAGMSCVDMRHQETGEEDLLVTSSVQYKVLFTIPTRSQVAEI